ncbi:hypothetical protein WBJ53_12780 [Spirosoma sp. SC4-14]|uniref:hypothetical protein n=1 Tax=Spirosoma sp. SC4-14 TaxID=3128900 RepID=UPI0030CDEA48
MKNIYLFLVFLGLSTSAWAQEVVFDTNYYAPPPVRRRVLTADPEDRRAKGHIGRTSGDRKADYLELHRLKETQTWYLSSEGGFRTDLSTLTNSFDGLVRSTNQTKFAWSILTGYTFHNAWAIETGYTHAPVHLNITITNDPSPFVFNYQNSGFGIPVRLKRRIGLGKNAANGTGFWLTAGAWLIPNGDGQTEELKFSGYSTYAHSHRIDTLHLNVITGTEKRISGAAELGVDYATRLSSTLELGFYVRKYWGLGNALRSDLTYTVNTTSQQQSAITANGTGWGFGISLRYIYGKQYEVKSP